MEQREINQQVFAHLTVQNMLLKELCLALFSVHEDKGDRFMAEFLHGLRAKLRVPADADPDPGFDVLRFQADALALAERFFDQVKAGQRRS